MWLFFFGAGSLLNHRTGSQVCPNKIQEIAVSIFAAARHLQIRSSCPNQTKSVCSPSRASWRVAWVRADRIDIRLAQASTLTLKQDKLKRKWWLIKVSERPTHPSTSLTNSSLFESSTPALTVKSTPNPTLGALRLTNASRVIPDQSLAESGAVAPQVLRLFSILARHKPWEWKQLRDIQDYRPIIPGM